MTLISIFPAATLIKILCSVLRHARQPGLTSAELLFPRYVTFFAIQKKSGLLQSFIHPSSLAEYARQPRPTCGGYYFLSIGHYDIRFRLHEVSSMAMGRQLLLCLLLSCTALLAAPEPSEVAFANVHRPTLSLKAVVRDAVRDAIREDGMHASLRPMAHFPQPNMPCYIRILPMPNKSARRPPTGVAPTRAFRPLVEHAASFRHLPAFPVSRRPSGRPVV